MGKPMASTVGSTPCTSSYREHAAAHMALLRCGGWSAAQWLSACASAKLANKHSPRMAFSCAERSTSCNPTVDASICCLCSACERGMQQEAGYARGRHNDEGASGEERAAGESWRRGSDGSMVVGGWWLVVRIGVASPAHGARSAAARLPWRSTHGRPPR